MPAQFGTDLTCTNCRHVFRLSQFIRVPCRHCQSEVRLRPEYIDERVTCKFCNHTFRVQARDIATEKKALQAAGAAQSPQAIAPKAQMRTDPSHGAGPPEIVDSSQLLIQLNKPQDQSAAESRQLDQSLRRELDQARAEMDRLRDQCASLEAEAKHVPRLKTELEAARAEGRRADKLAAEITAVRAERDDLLTKHQTVHQEAEQHRVKLAEIGKSLNAAVRQQAETQERHALLEKDQQRIEQETAARAEEARRKQAQLEDTRRCLEQDLAARDEQLRSAQKESQALRQERDAVQSELEAQSRKAQEWDRERETLLDQSRRDHAEKLDLMEKQWREEQTRRLDERQAQIEALRKELEFVRGAQTETATKTTQESESVRRRLDEVREACESQRRQKDAELEALRDRLAEVSRAAQTEQERLQVELGRSEAHRRQIEQERQTVQADAQRLRNDVETARLDRDQERQSAEAQRRALNEELDRSRNELEAMSRERDGIKEQAAEERKSSEKEWQQQLADLQRDFDLEAESFKKDTGRQATLAESLRQEREELRRRFESMKQQAKDKAESWETERQNLQGQIQTGAKQIADLDVRFRAEQAQVEELRKLCDATREAAPAEDPRLQQDLDSLRKQLDAANADLAKARQQWEERGQGWTVEKRSLQEHQQEECRRLTEEFEQRLKAELARCRENYQDQIEALQHERDSARSQFEALKQAAYHPEQQSTYGESISSIPIPPPAAGNEDRSALEQRLIAEQSQLHAQLRKLRLQLDDQQRQFEEEKQALVAEANRLRRGGRSDGGGTQNGLGARRSSPLYKVILYLALFLASVALAFLLFKTFAN
jgi:hypothetical protein